MPPPEISPYGSAIPAGKPPTSPSSPAPAWATSPPSAASPSPSPIAAATSPSSPSTHRLLRQVPPHRLPPRRLPPPLTPRLPTRRRIHLFVAALRRQKKLEQEHVIKVKYSESLLQLQLLCKEIHKLLLHLLVEVGRNIVEGEGRGAVADAGRAEGRRVGGNLTTEALLVSPVESWARDAESGGHDEHHQAALHARPSAFNSTDPFFLRFEAIRRSADLLPDLLAATSPPVSALVVDISLVSHFLPVVAGVGLPCYVLFTASAAGENQELQWRRGYMQGVPGEGRVRSSAPLSPPFLLK